MRNLAIQSTSSVTQHVIMLKLDGMFIFKCVKYSMLRKSVVFPFLLSVKGSIVVLELKGWLWR